MIGYFSTPDTFQITGIIRAVACLPIHGGNLVATPNKLLVKSNKPVELASISQEQIARMEREMASLQVHYKSEEESYGQYVLNLVLARGHLARLLRNSAVVRYLKRRQPDVLKEFETIVKIVALE